MNYEAVNSVIITYWLLYLIITIHDYHILEKKIILLILVLKSRPTDSFISDNQLSSYTVYRSFRLHRIDAAYCYRCRTFRDLVYTAYQSAVHNG